MTAPTIFCPQCDSLILNQEQCSNCQWRQPSVSGEVGKPSWAVALEAKLPSKESHPVANNHNIYFVAENGQIIAVDTLETGSENVIKWRYQLDSRYRCHGVAIWKEYILPGIEFAGGFPIPPGEFIMVNRSNGEEFWRYTVDGEAGASLSVPAIDNNVAYIAANRGWVYAIDLEGRQELWHQQVETGWSWSSQAPLYTPNGLLILTARNEFLTAFDVESQQVAWTFTGGGWFPHTSVWVDGVIYARCWDGHIYALDELSGEVIWQYKPPREFSSDPFVTQNYIYAGAKDYQGGAESGSRAYALYTLDRHSGERVGRYEVEGHVFAQPVATDTTVFFATDDKSRFIDNRGTLHALDAQGQELVWDEPFVIEQRLQSDLLIVDNLIITASRQGAVYGVPWRAGEAITESPQSYAAQGDWEKAAAAHALNGEYIQAAQVYAQHLHQPLHAGRLYLHAGEYQQVIELLGNSEDEAEKTLALQAIEAMPADEERAGALLNIGDFPGAAAIYVEFNEFEKAGDCYARAQDWQQAQNAYMQAGAWSKWEKLARELELWQDLVDRYVDVGQYAEAAEIQKDRGQFLDAAKYFDQAGMAAEALDAYRRVPPDDITDEAQRRMLEIAEDAGELEIAAEIYKAQGQLVKAAELSEASGHYSNALDLYRQAGEYRKAAEILEKQSRYAEASSMYERARRWGKAAENLEKQVEQEIERVGGIRYLQETEQLEGWLNRAIELYEEEADFAGETSRNELYEGADRCRVSLMRVRREPLLRLNLQADRLVYNQGNAIYYVVENVGWGTARNLSLSVSGSNLQSEAVYDLGNLGRRQKAEGNATVIPTLVGDIVLQVELRGQSRSGELHESVMQTLQVAPVPSAGGAGVSLNTQVGHGAERLRSTEMPIADRGSLWEVGASGSSVGPGGEAPVSRDQLRQQRIDSLRRQLAKHYSVLNLLEEEAADYPNVPVELQIKINKAQQKVDEIEDELEELEAEE